VWSETPDELRRPKRERGEQGWYKSPAVLGGGVVAATVALNLVFG
jgi:solute:Na+ symporter, SSS family